jgi:hypothetical protein
MPREHLLVAAPLAVVLCTWSLGAQANMAKWWRSGESYGPLVPRSETRVRVDAEDLTFDLSSSLDHAQVTATYRMTNGDGAAADAEVAFVIVEAEDAPRPLPEPHPSITLDGTPVAFQIVDETQAIEPALDAWLTAHPELRPVLDRLSAASTEQGEADVAELRRRVPGCANACGDLPRWYRMKEHPRPSDTAEDLRQAVVGAAGVAIPDDLAGMRSWSTLSADRPLLWLTFHLDFPPHATRSVIVRYDHAAGDDQSMGVNQTFTYDYLLSPARRWASFGPLSVAIHTPPSTSLTAGLPFTHDAETYRADLPRLPDGELSFAVMSTKGLLFGMTQPAGYWGILIALTAGITFPLSVRLGRAWARTRSRLGLGLLCSFGTAFAVVIADGAAIFLAGAAFPARALGFGYGPALGLILLLVASTIGGIMTSIVSALRARR